jgi:hypothetical protein
MNPNPYSPPLEPIEPIKVQNRLWTYLDIAAVICAAMPIILFAGMCVTDFLFDHVVALFFTILHFSFIGSCLLWLLGGAYNCARLIQGRRMALYGLTITVVSLVLWAAIFFLQFHFSLFPIASVGHYL